MPAEKPTREDMQAILEARRASDARKDALRSGASTDRLRTAYWDAYLHMVHALPAFRRTLAYLAKGGKLECEDMRPGEFHTDYTPYPCKVCPPCRLTAWMEREDG